MPSFPDWWTWELSFVGHAEMRMEQRGVTEVDVRAMLERASGFEPNVEAWVRSVLPVVAMRAILRIASRALPCGGDGHESRAGPLPASPHA